MTAPTPRKPWRNLWCCGCQREVVAILVGGAEIYPHRPDLAEKRFWRCACGCYVGCHTGTNTPLGNLPTAQIRDARQHIHRVLDPIWRTGSMPRRTIYSMLSDRIGRPYHTGEIRTIDEARQVYLWVRDIARGRA
jgi:hypothetical protein